MAGEGSAAARRRRRRRYRLAILVALLASGLALVVWQPPFLEMLLEQGRELAGRPWAPVVLVALQAILLTFALPGTLVLLVVAPLYPPITGTALLTTGAVLGAMGAYVISRWAGSDAGLGAGSRRIIDLLTERGDFLTQLALRVMPGFPHSVVNYGAGILGLPLPTFLAAATLGLGVKWFVYCSAVNALVQAGAEEEPLGLRTLAPLLLLAVLLAVSALVRQWLLGRRRKKEGQ
jgi:uncharacterized membrane protein YdjX (TVP38/TMEM64 family)